MNSYSSLGMRWVVTLTAVLAAGCGAKVETEKSQPIASTDVGKPTQATASQKQWHDAMWVTPTPKDGCFHATYPGLAWNEVPCIKVEEPPYRPANVVDRQILPPQEFVGGGGTQDIAAMVTNGSITTAEGQFPETYGYGNADRFSLQINTNPFTTASGCQFGAASCQGWQQFIYSTHTGHLFIQYWLINYGATCPPSQGWHSDGGVSCYKNSVEYDLGDNLTNLQDWVLGGRSLNGHDTVAAGGLTSMSAATQTAVFDLDTNPVWNIAEFNVFGDGSQSPAANFDGAHPHVNVQIEVTNEHALTTVSPTVQAISYTAEVNNFTIVPGSPCSYPGIAGFGRNKVKFSEGFPGDVNFTAAFCLLNDITPIQFPL